MQMLSPKELAASSGWPEGRIRRMIAGRQLSHVRVGGLILIPANAIEEFLSSNLVAPCPDNPSDRASSGETESPASMFAISTRKPASQKTYLQVLETASKRRNSSKIS